MVVAIVAALGLFAAPAGATVVIDGTPLNAYTDRVGGLQARFDDANDNVFFPPFGDQGDAGFFLGFPEGPLAGRTYGPGLIAGPGLPAFTPVSQGGVTGSGTPASPYAQQMVYRVKDGLANEYAEVTQTITYVNGESRFKMAYAVENITSPPAPLRFRAAAAADLFLEGDDFGTGFLSLGPPRFVAGANHTVGRSGGIEEVAGSKWSGHQVDSYDTIWGVVADPFGAGFANTLVEELVDNGVGVQWDDHYGAGDGLAGGATAIYEAIWRFASFVPLRLEPIDAERTVGSTHRVTATATDVNGVPAVGKAVRYTVTGANTHGGVVSTSATGEAQIAWSGINHGVDTLTAFVDLNSDGARQPSEPELSATVSWTTARVPRTTRPPEPPMPLTASVVVRRLHLAGRSLKVPVNCRARAAVAGCAGSLTAVLRVKQRVKRRRGKRRGARRRTRLRTRRFRLASRQYKLATGAKTTLALTVPRRARRFLRQRRRGWLLLTVQAGGREPETFAVRVIVRRKKRR